MAYFYILQKLAFVEIGYIFLLGKSYVRAVKMSYKQRKARVGQKLQSAAAKLLAEAGGEDEEEEE